VARRVLFSLCLGGGFRSFEWLRRLLSELTRIEGPQRGVDDPSPERLRNELREAKGAGLVEEHSYRAGEWRLAPHIEASVLLDVLDHPRFDALRSALLLVDGVEPPGKRYWKFASVEIAVAVMRLDLLTGSSPQEVARRWGQVCGYFGLDAAISQSLLSARSFALFHRLHPAAQLSTVKDRLVAMLSFWKPEQLPLDDCAQHLLATPDAAHDLHLLSLLAQYRWCCGNDDGVRALLAPMSRTGPLGDPLAHAFGGAMFADQGRWADAQRCFEEALAILKKATGERKNLLPNALQWSYVQCLLAQGTPQTLDKALRFCMAEAGQRRPTQDSEWGVAALALQMRRGDIARDVAVFERSHGAWPSVQYWRWLMRAWLKDDAAAQTLTDHNRDGAIALLNTLKTSGMRRLHEQLEDALNVLQANPVRRNFFIAGVQESWEASLDALLAIGGSGALADAGDQDSRILWLIWLTAAGAVHDIMPFEQKRGVRGWNKAQPVSLRKLSTSTRLPPHDTRVIERLRKESGRTSHELQLELHEAVMALVGHPAVAFADQADVMVALEAAPPRLEVVEEAANPPRVANPGSGKHLRLSLHPPMRAPYIRPGASAADKREAEALAGITILRDGAQRARVVRYTAEQRRAAVLLGSGLKVPAEATARLQPVLQSLAAHFEVHMDAPGDDADATEVTAESALRAELKPVDAGLHVRLVVAPLGPDGPRCVPGRGRARLMASVNGQTLRAVRDLPAELEHVEQVLQDCPLLQSGQDGDAEFEVPDAQDALSVLEALSKLECVQALDWPAGRQISVTPVDLGHLRLQVRTDRDWFALAGGVHVDEVRVIQVQQLLQWNASARGRFVPLGDGRYLALTQELRARIAEMATVVDVRSGEASVPAVAAAWLHASLQGTEWQSDDGLQDRLDRLAAARTLQPSLPAALRAELRPYQVDGYQWAMRLAASGWGACLADDMGLGKTLQALAVLIARATDSAGGPALVVAPTSLMGNWLSEARRFAPTLRFLAYGEAMPGGVDRDALLRDAAAGDVVLVSYSLLHFNAEAFAARSWHTLILDEAQALKNAAAKRTQAAQTLQADFRLALSGTPIENRLAELWSIMQICNPGLLGTLARFNERFAVPIERDRDRDAQRTLKRLTAPFVLRRTKAQVLDDLPARTELTLRVQPGDDERAHYEALRREAVDAAQAGLAEGGGKAQINVLAQLTRLRRAACDPRLVSPAVTMSGAKVQAFADLAEELAANGHKALVFSQFVDFLQLLRQPLDAAGIAYQYLDGSTPAVERTRRVAAFQAGEGTLFLISLKAGGFGLNLTVADYVVIADPWWNPAAEDQASGRAHRIGQLRPVTVYRLVNAGTLEERIVELHQHKRALAEGVIDGAESGAPLDARTLVELMRG
jgi:superfamily II DNA or RNA helicase